MFIINDYDRNSKCLQSLDCSLTFTFIRKAFTTSFSVHSKIILSDKKGNTKNILFWLIIFNQFHKLIKHDQKRTANIFKIWYLLRRLNVVCVCGQYLGFQFVLSLGKLNNSENKKIFTVSVYHEQSAAIKIYAAAKSPGLLLFLFPTFLKDTHREKPP